VTERRAFNPAVTPYEQGRNDRRAGRTIDDSPYGAMGNQQLWQEGWVFQDKVEEVKATLQRLHDQLEGKEASMVR
jgi:hypothetical protein